MDAAERKKLRDDVKAAVERVMEGREVGLEESFELLEYLNLVSAEIAKQIAEHFRKHEENKDENEQQADAGHPSDGGGEAKE